MRTLRKIVAELSILGKARRNRTDLARYLIRRPALIGAISGYETALLVSSRAPNRLKALAQVKSSSLIGCPF
jgi:hypothetical protein